MSAVCALDTSDQTSTAPQVEDFEPALPAVLLQRVALDRANPQRPDSRTTRVAISYARACWAFCSSLMKLSVQDFREHLRSGLTSLPLDKTTGARLSQQLLPLSNVPSFWEVVANADSILRRVEENPHACGALHARIWSGQFFHEQFAGQPHAYAWPQLARDLLTLLHAVRAYAHGLITQRANFLWTLWAQGNFTALLVGIQEELPAAWIVDAVATIERAARSEVPTPARRQARAEVKKINTARGAVGKGRSSRRTEQDVRIAKRHAVATARAATRLLAYYDRLRAKEFHHPAALRCTVERFQHSEHLSDPVQKAEILKRFADRLSTRRKNVSFSD